MSTRPEIKPEDWITVEAQQCVVAVVREAGHILGDCEVVFDPHKPTNRDVVWENGKWHFVKTGDYGGYAANYLRLSRYVDILRTAYGLSKKKIPIKTSSQ